MRLRTSFLAAVCLLSACGGGGGGATGSLALPVSSPASAGRAQLHLVLPAATSTASRHRAYVGGDAAGLTVAVGPHGGTLTTTAFALDASTCVTSGGQRDCTIAVTAPIGSDDFAVAIYDAAPVNGAIPSSAHLLGTASQDGVSVAGSGTPTAISLVVAAQVGSLGVGIATITLPANGTTQTANAVIVPNDFNNQPITSGGVVTYANPITATLVETGGSGHSVLTVNGTASGSSATISQSSQQLGVQFDGKGASGYYATITLSASGATSASFAVVPMYVTSTAPYYANGALAFTAAGQTASFSVNEAQGNAAYTAAASSASCAGTVTASGSGTSGTASITSGAAAGSGCSLLIADASGTVYPIPYTTTTTASAGPTIGGVTEYAMPLGSLSRPEPIAAGPDGNLWVGDEAAGQIDKVTTSGSITTYNVPSGAAPPYFIVAGNDGDLWYVDGLNNALYQATTSGTITQHVGLGTGPFQGLAAGADGNLWVADQGGSGSGAMLQVSMQAQLVGTYAPLDTGITATAIGSNGKVYVISSAGSLYYIVTPHFPVASNTLPGACTSPSAIAEDPQDGNIYVGCSSALVQIPPSGSPVAIGLGQNDGVRGVVAGPDGSIWFTGSISNTIGRYNPTTGTVTHYAIPTSGGVPIGIAVGSDGRIWFTEFSAGKIGVITP